MSTHLLNMIDITTMTETAEESSVMKRQKFETSPSVSRRMSRVPQKRGRAERLLAKSLWREGYRYRLNYRALPGSPDIALQKYRIAVFIDGAFWHGYHWPEQKKNLKTNREYWIQKIESNMKRDEKNDTLLKSMDWLPLHFWEKEVIKDLKGCIRTIEAIIIQEIIDALPDEPLTIDE